jgi:hypothetical protein
VRYSLGGSPVLFVSRRAKKASRQAHIGKKSGPPKRLDSFNFNQFVFIVNSRSIKIFPYDIADRRAPAGTAVAGPVHGVISDWNPFILLPRTYGNVYDEQP